VRITLDSNILVRAVTSPGGPALRLLDIILASHTLGLSRFILDEVERVLLYPRIQARYRITAGEAARFTGNLSDASHLVEPIVVKPITLSDPADDPVLYTAADGKADVLCTRNIRHFSSPAARVFCEEHGIRVMTDTDILRDLFGGQ
jgi:putative PIN family toxin of toxin-antitoxin system